MNSIKQLGLYDIGQTIGSGTFSKVQNIYVYAYTHIKLTIYKAA